MMRQVLRTMMVAAGVVLAVPQTGWACQVCFGDPNSAMSIGASWGILLLLGITGGVLAAFASFFSLSVEAIQDGGRRARRSVPIVAGWKPLVTPQPP
jgi:hypothetical protein